LEVNIRRRFILKNLAILIAAMLLAGCGGSSGGTSGMANSDVNDSTVSHPAFNSSTAYRVG
jgi:uncharacterized lipoprotein YajG